MSRSFKIILLFLAFVVIWVFLAPFLGESLIVEHPIDKADAILVLSGSSAYMERTQKAAEAYKAGIAERVLLTDDGGYGGWSEIERRNPPFVNLAQRNLIALGVDKNDIEILSPQVTGTIYEARVLKKKISDENWKSVLLVTSPYHTRRTIWTFQHEIPDPHVEFGIVSLSQERPKFAPSIWWLSATGWKTVVGEYVKIAVYWLFF